MHTKYNLNFLNRCGDSLIIKSMKKYKSFFNKNVIKKILLYRESLHFRILKKSSKKFHLNNSKYCILSSSILSNKTY